jgi:TetR/AcrR family transcriptional regulator, cholesterol catabolism regulator
MASVFPQAASPDSARGRAPRAPAALETRFNRRLGKILSHATEVFYEKGYEGASMRDLSRASGMSLAGLYYYFESKEKLLYLIQKDTFATVVRRLQQRLRAVDDPEACIRIFILNHLEYFLSNRKAMTVLSHEDDVLKNGFGQEVAAIKREYYRICTNLLDDFKREHKLAFSSRIAVLSLFGTINWIYTWYNPRVDASAPELAAEMSDMFLRGICGTIAKRTRRKKSVLSN